MSLPGISKAAHFDKWVPEVGELVLISVTDPDSRVYSFNGLEVKIDAVFSIDGDVCIAFHHPTRGLGCSRLMAAQPIKSEAEKLRDENITALIRASFPKDENKDCLSITFQHAINMHDNGCRMTRELTDEVARKLWRTSLIDIEGMVITDIEGFAQMVAAYVRGENV